MESERNKFIDSFKEATKELENNLHETKEQLLNETNTMIKELKLFYKKISESLDDIYSSADNADNNTSSVETTVSDIEDTVDDIWRILTAITYLIPRIDSNTKNNNFESRDFMKESLSRFLTKVNQNVGFSERIIDKQIKILRSIYPEVSKKEMDLILKELNGK
jgi:hypothetical protein